MIKKYSNFDFQPKIKFNTYLLNILIRHPIKISRPSTLVLSKGYYFYIGSAKGPGGFSSRIKRHFLKDKKIHWHIDQITADNGSSIIGIYVTNFHSECLIVKKLQSFKEITFPILNFGSTDCKNGCISHLLSFNSKTIQECELLRKITKLKSIDPFQEYNSDD